MSEPPSLPGRLLLYLLLGGLGALTFSDGMMAVSRASWNLPVIITASCFLLGVYLPLLDWPYLAWRHTGRPLFCVLALATALLLPFGLPAALNANQAQASPAWPLKSVPQPVVAANILLVGEARTNGEEDACGAFCQQLLWSGQSDHVLARRAVTPNQHLEGASLFTVEKSDHCAAIEGPPPTPRNGLCIVARTVLNPSFDAMLKFADWQADKPDQLPLGRQLLTGAAHRKLEVYNCHLSCERIAVATAQRTERLSLPLWLTFDTQQDGFFLARHAGWIGGPDAILSVLLHTGMDADGPRPGFRGDISQGGPPMPDIDWRDKPLEEFHEPDSAPQYAKDVDAKLNAYRKARRAIYQAHRDCTNVVITPGPNPQYGGCED